MPTLKTKRTSKKGDIDILFVFIVIAFATVVFLWLYDTVNNLRTIWCKETQMKELKKVWDELRYFNSIAVVGSGGEIIPPEGYNLVTGVSVEWCVEEFKYLKDEHKLYIKYADGTEDKLPAGGVWLNQTGEPLLITIPGSYDFKVSFNKTQLI